jgi:hypothetical protein
MVGTAKIEELPTAVERFEGLAVKAVGYMHAGTTVV